MPAKNEMFELIKTGTIVIGVVAVALAALLVFLAIKGKKAGKKNIVFNIIIVLVMIPCILIIPVLQVMTGVFAPTLNTVMTLNTASAEHTSMGDWRNLAYTIAEEGMVLLENKNGALPLDKSAKVNLLGYIAYNPIYSGTGSGFVSNSDSIDIVSSLEAAGIQNNPALPASNIYAKVASPNDDQAFGFIAADFSLNEPAPSVYTGDVSFDSLKGYSDTAIIVLGRRGAEGEDLPSDYLPITANEDALLKAASENFGKVIVVINSANALEMDWVKKYDIDAVIWAGLPGPYGFEALGKLLTGEVNPSGRLPDTWLYDNDSNPVNENFGVQEAENAAGRFYVDYVEGIYVGYKWFETAYAEKAVITNTKTGETFDYSNYDSVVAYPFGHGLSYTTFEQKITGGTMTNGTTLSATGSYTVEVTVKNTGSTAGKCVVELYVTVPYTDYDKANLVEKSEVSLVAIGKTKLLQPNASETVTLEISMEALASYDSSHANGDGTKGAYMLDAGDYTFSLRADSHCVLDSVTAQLSGQHFFSGTDKRASDQVPAVNQFDDAARGEYLSRQNGFANYASAMASVKPRIENPAAYATVSNQYDPALDAVVSKTYKEGVDYGAKGELTLADMTGLAYDDPKWDLLIAQMSLEDLMALTGYNMYSSPAIESIGKNSSSDADGPLGLSSMFKNDLVSVSFPCVALMTATFNTELAYEMGSSVADQAAMNGITSWYAPAMDIHRSAFSGRNYEYYSEDATLSACMAASETRGARDKNIIVYIKHFALNDMESKRDRVHTYSNEQAIREIYLKPFEYAVKQGHANGIMTSMNYIGDVYAGGHLKLLTNVVRGEWAFVGTIMTDMDQAGEIRSFWSAIRAGMDWWLGWGSPEIAPPSSDADIYYLQRAVHNLLYTMANSNIQTAIILNWKGCVNIICVEFAIVAASCVAALVLRNKKRKG